MLKYCYKANANKHNQISNKLLLLFTEQKIENHKSM